MLANKTVSINVDLGEVEDAIRQAAEVIPWVDSVNVALGGHAGSPEVAREICALANPAGVAVHLHPGYPDRSGFGRRHMEMPRDELLYSLSQQRDVLPDIKVCKFHGALYNGADQDAALAATLLDWCVEHRVHTILAPDSGHLQSAAMERDVKVIREAFGDRRYVRDGQRIRLADRGIAGSVIESPEQILDSVRQLVRHNRITLLESKSPPSIACRKTDSHEDQNESTIIAFDMICLHGDTPYFSDAIRLIRQRLDLSVSETA